MRKNSIKNLRINEAVLRELSDILRNKVKDPRVQGQMISVTSVEVAPDLKTCKVYISVLGGEEEREHVFKGLASSQGFIRHELAKTVNLRLTPVLTFLPDDSIEYGVNMAHRIEEVRDEDRRRDEEALARTKRGR